MRKFNAILTVVILLLFLFHAIFGSFQMLGAGNTALKTLAWVDVFLIGIHVILGVKLTYDTLKALKKAGVSYFKENRLFWARRISGFAVMIFMVFHLTAFGYTENGLYRLRWFTTGKLVTQILLLVTLAVHVLSNVRPMLISFGVKSLKERTGEIWFILSVLLLFMGLAFVVYWLRWNG